MLIAVIMLTFYVALLHHAQRETIAPVYGPIGVTYVAPDVNGLLGAVLGLILTLLLLPRSLRQPSDFVVWALYVVLIVPAMVVPTWDESLGSTSYSLYATVALGSFVLVVLGCRRLGTWSIRLPVPPALFWIGIAIVSLITYGYMAFTTGLRVEFIGLFDVRETRLGYLAAIQSFGTGLAYLLTIQGHVVNPLIIAVGLARHHWWALAAGILGQLVIYSLTGYKMVILSIPLTLVLVIVLTLSDGPFKARLVLTGATLVTFVSILIDSMRNSYDLSLLFIARLLVVPATIAATHISFFTGREKVTWGDSFLAEFVDNPYQRSAALMVGNSMSGDTRNNANASYIGDGFANLGYTGVLVEAAALILLLRVLNATCRDLPNYIQVCLAVVPTLVLANTSVFTSVLTGGFGAAILVGALHPREPVRSLQSRGSTEVAPHDC